MTFEALRISTSCTAHTGMLDVISLLQSIHVSAKVDSGVVTVLFITTAPVFNTNLSTCSELGKKMHVSVCEAIYVEDSMGNSFSGSLCTAYHAAYAFCC
jgi:hypothetical protein